MTAIYFGVIRCKTSGKVRRIFNPDEDWEFSSHHVDATVEYLTTHEKEAWGVPRTPNGMTLELVSYIVAEIERGSNR